MWFTSNKKAFDLGGTVMNPKRDWFTLIPNSESLLFSNATTLGQHCGKVLRVSKKGGDYHKIGIVAPTQKVRDDAKTFFEGYFL